ncbi:MAG: signal transduction histidine kinase/CheY-like chemotaxis protein [Glaciecola sp.]|jgi:signal transduction histidine kinase/CheY-like chemotaxis protein
MEYTQTMNIAEMPADETSRLEALYRYKILDTENESVFDELTQLASEICDTPIALISLIDPDRQWFKSKVGLDAEETERDIAFCTHAINQDNVFEVNDTLHDERFKDNPLVTSGPNIRFYAGVPLITPDGHAIGTICAISDKPKKLNRHQCKAMKILSREVISQLELRLRLIELQEENERRTEFLSRLSHELRTPLHSILSLSQLMLADDEFKLSKKNSSYLQHIDFSGQRLLKLVTSILNISKIEEGCFKLHERTMNVTDFFFNLEGMISSLANEKRIDINFNLTSNNISRIKIDDLRLTQVILNLVSNSIKFSTSKQSIFIDVAVSKTKIVIAVKDDGIGISENDISLLFNKLQRVGNNNNEEGAGLGLALSKSLIELMNGNIKLFSKLNKGTLVKVNIPLNSSHIDRQPVNAELLRKCFDPKIKILVVEDNDINQEVAKAIFGSIDLNIDIANNGESGVIFAHKYNYDVIFMDLHLPGFDGFEASRRIIESNPQQIIIALTADVFAKQNPKVITCGIQGILNKPLDINVLLDFLNKNFPMK